MSREYPIKVVCVSLEHSDVSKFWQHAFVVGQEYLVKEDDRRITSSHLKYIWGGDHYTLTIPKSHFRLADEIDAHNMIFNPKIEIDE